MVFRDIGVSLLVNCQFSTSGTFQVSCSGMYVNDGSLVITCTSPQGITSIDYSLNDGDTVTGYKYLVESETNCDNKCFSFQSKAHLLQYLLISCRKTR